ncbi:hypothetical protein EV183_000543 [Coemansia sp. RSA 2336]|nr:hypothetical protein EV183_000543 [Coemansia sp. RSA 2336]
MGRTGKTLRSHSFLQDGTHRPSTRSHPYMSKHCAQPQPPTTTEPPHLPLPHAQSPKPVDSTLVYAANLNTSSIDAVTANSINSDSWSPFDAPLVQQCMAGNRTQSLSLLENKQHTPMYVPSSTAISPRNPSLFTTTYAGHSYANEEITVRIMDVESGEYLYRFPYFSQNAQR